MNVDGASRADGLIAGCGGLIRTAAGEWIVSFCMELETMDSFSA